MAGIIARSGLLVSSIEFNQGNPFGDLFGLTVYDGLMLDMMLPGFWMTRIKASSTGFSSHGKSFIKYTKMNKAKQKARAKANAMPAKNKLFEFVDKAGVPGNCTVTLPAERFSYIISRRVAENLLVKHGYNLPFDIMTPCLEEYNNQNDEWMGISPEDLTGGKLDKDRKEFEIWLDFETTD